MHLVLDSFAPQEKEYSSQLLFLPKMPGSSWVLSTNKGLSWFLISIHSPEIDWDIILLYRDRDILSVCAVLAMVFTLLSVWPDGIHWMLCLQVDEVRKQSPRLQTQRFMVYLL